MHDTMKNRQAILPLSMLFFIMAVAIRYGDFHTFAFRQIGNIALLHALDPNSLLPERNYFDRSKLFNSSNLVSAKNYYLKADDKLPHSLGFVALAQADFNESQRWLGLASQRDNNSRYFLGESFLLNDDISQTIVEWEQIEAQNQIINLALVLGDQGDLNGSRRLFQSALGLPGLSIRNQGIAHRSLAQSYYEEDNLTAAKEHYYKLLELFPTDPHAYALLGSIYRRQGDYSQAIEYFDEALLLGFQRPEWIWTNKGRTYEALKEWDAAAGAYLQVLETSPLDKTALQLLVIANCKSGQEREARLHFEQLKQITDADFQKNVDELAGKFASCLDESL